MTPSVRATLKDLGVGGFDVLVIGGGITGAGIAREAALHGLSTALVEARDFGEGTSSRSSRLIHGGLRYLEQGRLHLVRESLRERSILLRLAPHLVRPLPFILPVFEGDRVPRWKITAGLALYDILAAGSNVRRHRTLGKRALLDQEPLIRERGLTGGALYFDAQCDDARLVVATVRAAADRGAVVANHTRVTSLIPTVAGIRGAYLRDELTGEEGEVRARLVVNATGPWSDFLRRMEDPKALPLLRATKGVHVLVPRARVGNRHGIIFTSRVDGRVMFVLPWGDAWTYIGTTDTDAHLGPDNLAVDPEDAVYLLRSANSLFPTARLGPQDVVASWAGLRPLLAADPAAPASAISREHRIVRGPAGLYTIAGGKLTTWRRMAVQMTDVLVKALGHHRSGKKSESETTPLPGGETGALDTFRVAGVEAGLPEATVDHLVGHFGAETPAIYKLCRERPELAERLHPDHPAIAAEVVFSLAREFVVKAEDFMARRIHLTTETLDHGEAARPAITRLLTT